ncbi:MULTISPECIES: phage holin family protein [unclassified Bacillus (in: firmicutes)]|uniref:phage holin family protein n=1 Tax=unclassified Bacillus (in: firmicutes) TaxID=185979 RepID=UPI0008E64A71|nr:MULTISPECIES: phage holin family protein [unclassified Bacillus (in: firmicutes)]SFA72095.1 Phage holin family Hol44, holin superfamily V [Bacillus sp. UNCCL13]SFQ62356.1 Phage holin family Hol44, holin superfamily V [Bacillus sp. cl95]
MNLIDFLNENYFMLVPALCVLGYALKQTPQIPNWSIIWILFFMSFTLATYAYGFEFEAIVNSITATGVSLFGQQLLCIRDKDPPSDKKDNELD